MDNFRPPTGGRSVIPPTSPPHTHTGEALSVLQHRLASVEDDAKDLVNQLAKMGFHGTGDGRDNDMPKDPAFLTVPPYKAPIADTKVLQQNYEVLVSRVCKMESAVQTMKLNLLRAQAERDLSKEEKASANEKLTTTAEAYEKELSKLSRELVQARKDLKEGQEDRRRAREDVKSLQEALDVATTGKSEAAGMIEDLRAAKTKLTRRTGELREEMGREASLRASLEESHNTLLSRVQDMEDIVTREQEEVTKLNTTCSALKRDCLRAREEAELERSLRLQAENTIKKLTNKSEGRQSELETLQEDKAYLMTEMTKLRQRYQDLIAQLDQTHQLAADKQSTHEQLEKENKRLYEAMKSAAAQNAKLIAKYEQELEELRAEAVAKAQGEQHIKELSEQLRSESRQKGHVLATSSQQEARIQELEEKVARQEAELTERTEKHRKEVGELRESLRDKEAEKDHAMRDKDSLLDEVNQAVDEMVEERGRLQAQLSQKDVDLQSAEQARKQLEQENGRLLERLAALEEQAAASGQVEKALSEMMEQKNKLSYDKGRLTARVEDLQREVESLANAQSELTQLRKTAATMDANYKKTQTELNNGRITTQRLESQIKQAQNSGNRKEEDFRLAIKARDEALQEGQRLMDHIEELEERERQRVSGLERSLGDTRQDNKKVAATLDSVMQSHSQLQMTVEGLQLELGRRDSRITQLSADKSDLTHRARQLQKELDNLQSKLVSMETLEANEVDPLRSALQQCKSDNSKMASSLETVVRSNGQLQASVQTLQDEVEKKTFLLEQTNDAREKEREQHVADVRACEDRVVHVKEQLAREKEKAIKRNNKEVLEVRRQLEDLLSKNGDLSRANAELRHRVTDLEYECREQKDKVSAHRAQNEHLTRVRQKQEESVRNLQSVSEQLATLEKSNREYVKKNDNQAKLIQKFMSQMASIQEELHGVAQTQADMAGMLQQQEEQLRAERSKYDELKRKYKATRKREVELEELRRQTEEKLLEANNESLEITANLTDAHSWFKSKFDSLQTELTKSRKNQAGLVHENYEAKMLLEGEKKMAHETAEKARQMIKASRETISRLADYAEVAQKETRNQMLGMRYQLESEKDYARVTEAKYKGLQESSLRHTEQLARELDMMRSGYNRHYDSLDSSG